MSNIKAFLASVSDAYFETLLWSECLDDQFNTWDISPVDTAEQEEQLADFLNANWDDLEGLTPSDIGHNFVLSRNRLGTGFWDRGLGDRGDRLHEAAKVYGEVNAYVGDDGKLYIS